MKTGPEFHLVNALRHGYVENMRKANFTSLKLQKDTLQNHMAPSSTALFNLPVAPALPEDPVLQPVHTLTYFNSQEAKTGAGKNVYKNKTA